MAFEWAENTARMEQLYRSAVHQAEEDGEVGDFAHLGKAIWAKSPLPLQGDVQGWAGEHRDGD